MKYKLRRSKRHNWSGNFKLIGCKDVLVPTLSKNLYPKVGLSPDKLKELEIEMGMVPGSLSLTSPYWKTLAQVVVPDSGEVEFDDDNPEDLIKVSFLKEKDFVANGFEELKTKPKAEYVLYSVLDEQKTKNKTNKKKADAFKKFYELSVPEMRDLLYLYGVNNEEMDTESVEASLFEQVELNPSKFLEIVQDEDFKIKVLINKLVLVGILTRRGSSYIYEDQILGGNLESTIEFLLENKNQNIKLALEKLLQEKLAGVYSRTAKTTSKGRPRKDDNTGDAQ